MIGKSGKLPVQGVVKSMHMDTSTGVDSLACLDDKHDMANL